MTLLNFSEDEDMLGMKRNVVLALAVAAAVAAPSAFATYGYFSHGYGMTAKGMAGASTAMAKDTFGGANNPASMVWVGNRLDVGVDVFSPHRKAQRSDTSAPFAQFVGSSDSESTEFLVPEFGYNSMLSPDSSFGVTVYGNGGMNTNYKSGVNTGSGATVCNNFGVTGTGQNILCGNGNAGVDLAQMIIAPTLSYKITPSNSVGISPLIGFQRFKAEGLHGFAGFSRESNYLTNNGYDTSTGAGVRVGWLGKVNNMISLGAAYSSRMYMSSFEKYRGLFAEQGDFDIPANWNVGAAIKFGQSSTVAIDFQKIDYASVRSVGNSSRNYGTTTTNSLGPDDGRGFGWSNVKVWKLGFEHQASGNLTLRAGYGLTTNPVNSRDVTFNILAPAVVRQHYTLGGTFSMGKSSDITAAFMHAANNSVSGPSLFQDFGIAGANEKIEMYQNSLGVAWSQKW